LCPPHRNHSYRCSRAATAMTAAFAMVVATVVASGASATNETAFCAGAANETGFTTLKYSAMQLAYFGLCIVLWFPLWWLCKCLWYFEAQPINNHQSTPRQPLLPPSTQDDAESQSNPWFLGTAFVRNVSWRSLGGFTDSSFRQLSSRFSSRSLRQLLPTEAQLRQVQMLSSPKNSERTGHVPMENYLFFLKSMRNMFLVLTVVSVVMTWTIWGITPFFEGSIASATRKPCLVDLSETMINVLFTNNVLYAVVILAFTVRFEKNIVNNKQNSKIRAFGKNYLDRTIWVRRLPVRDRWHSTVYKLTDEEIQRVSNDLKCAVEDYLFKNAPKAQAASDGTKRVWVVAEYSDQEARRPGVEALKWLDPAFPDDAGKMLRMGNKGLYQVDNSDVVFIKSVPSDSQKSRVVQIKVAPVIEELYAVSLRRHMALEYNEMYKELSASGPRWRRWRYERKAAKCEHEAHKLRQKQLKIMLGKKQLSGSAFITFKSRAHCSLILQSAPGCWDCRRWCFSDSRFSFGRQPFEAVTLSCYRAPHPDDVNWHYLHANWYACQGRFCLGMLIVAGLFLGLSELVHTMSHPHSSIAYLHREYTMITGRIKSYGWPPIITSFWNVLGYTWPEKDWEVYLISFSPTVLLLINSIVLPFAIQAVAVLEKSELKSKEELRQLDLNFYSLMLTSCIMPILKLSNIRDYISTMKENFEPSAGYNFYRNAVHLFGKSLVLDSGEFALQYLIGSFALLNAFQLVKVPLYSIVMWLRLKLAALSKSERKECKEMLPYAWGWWYAWVLSVVAVAIVFSVLVPLTLPMATLFFWIRHQVDSYNLRHRYVDLGPDSEELFARAAAHKVRVIVCIWGCMMGFSFNWICHHKKHSGECKCPVVIDQYGSILLSMMSFLVLVSTTIGRKYITFVDVSTTPRGQTMLFTTSPSESPEPPEPLPVSTPSQAESPEPLRAVSEQHEWNWDPFQSIRRDEKLETWLQSRPALHDELVKRLGNNESVEHYLQELKNVDL